MITNTNIGYTGRFGNQIFQFAALFGIGRKLGYDIVIPKSNLEGQSQTLMDGTNFSSKFILHECFELDNFFGQPTNLKYKVQEMHFHFDKNLFRIPDFCDINGYFQTDKYFEHCEDELIETLKFRSNVEVQAKEILPKTQKELVSVHIRRGDYTHPNPYHTLLGLDYINKAISNFEDSKYHFVVFSDDIEWCKGIWTDSDNFTIFKSESQFLDFCAMSLCQHHIISNSSFSWWSSYLSKNKSKKIIAPKDWFGPGLNHNTSDLYTKKMIII